MTDESIAERWPGVRVLVEATSFEEHSLWLMHSKDGEQFIAHMRTTRLFKWEQLSGGVLTQINDEPIMTVHLRPVRIDGRLLIFYDAPSKIVDYGIVDAWLDKQFSGVRRVDANNFHNALNALGL